MPLFLTAPNGTIYEVTIDNTGAFVQTPVLASSVTSTPLTGAQISDMVSRRTERRGDKYLDMQTEYLFALQEFYKEHHWFWRRKTATFTTTAGVATYDLSSNSGGLPGITDFEQFCKNGVRLFRNTSDFDDLEPIFDFEQQDRAIEDTTQDSPAKYFIEPGTLLTMRLTKIPNGAYKIRVAYWSVPSAVTITDAPPIPGHLSMVLTKCLEKNVLKFLLGDGDPTFVTAQKDYDAAVAKANSVSDFMRGRPREYSDQSDESVQSH